MKKTLLFAGLILWLPALFSQTPFKGIKATGKTKPVRVEDYNEEAPLSLSPVGAGTLTPQQWRETDQTSGAPPSSITWNLLSGASSAYGMSNSNSRPLQYNHNVNAISFIHRKSATYAETPSLPSSAKSGVLVAEVSSNWGATWDSTCVWAHANYYGRFPQGAIYSAPGNSSIANAYMVSAAVAVSGANYAGVIYGSKPIGVPGSTVFSSTADATPNALQFFFHQLHHLQSQPVQAWLVALRFQRYRRWRHEIAGADRRN